MKATSDTILRQQLESLLQFLEGKDLASVNKKVDVVEVKVEKQQEQINEILTKFDEMNKKISGKSENKKKQLEINT